MLVELHVRNLGVIEDLVLEFGPGMTALTGETGAGKTLLVEALELLMGARADASLVRQGEKAATIEGRFARGDSETVLARELPADGRSRAWIDGRMATVASLAEIGADLIDLHGQHAHQSLLHPPAQRGALDEYAKVTTDELDAASDELRLLDEQIAELGGDEHALARELDLLSYQLTELDRAALSDPDEEATLEVEERLLSRAESFRAAAQSARSVLADDGGARDLLAVAHRLCSSAEPLADLAGRLMALGAELEDVSAELRERGERFEDDPERLNVVQERKHLLAELRRKYGSQLSDVIAYGNEVRQRIDSLAHSEIRRSELMTKRHAQSLKLEGLEAALGAHRRAAAPGLAEKIQSHLRKLGLSRTVFEVAVGPGRRGDDVEFRFGANEGEATLPLARAASGGELARAMLATRLVLTAAPPTLVFDEVDAGIGGQAALHVGRALADVALSNQVLVVTHLAQVAAFAGRQVAIEKHTSARRTLTTAHEVTGDERLAELSRMLSGQPFSVTGRRHAKELLEVAAAR